MCHQLVINIVLSVITYSDFTLTFPPSLQYSIILSNLNNVLLKDEKKSLALSHVTEMSPSKCHAIPNLHYLIQGPKDEEI